MTIDSISDNATAILDYLRSLPQPAAAVDILAKQISLDEASVHRALKQLEQWGYRFEHDTGKIMLTAAPDRLIDTEIGYGLGTETIGSVMHTYQAVKSTNDVAHSLAESGAHEGTIVTAEEQTKGRGRQGRQWHSPPGSGIYVSIILRPKLPPEDVPPLSLVTALSLAETAAEYCPGHVQVKWPNDVLIDGHKTAGILTELHADRNNLRHVIVGVGINVLLERTDMPGELQQVATSIKAESNRPVRRVALLQEFLRRFEQDYGEFARTRLVKLLPRIRSMSFMIGREVELDVRGEKVGGTAIDIDSSGRLIIDVAGEHRAVVSGEVRVLSID